MILVTVLVTVRTHKNTHYPAKKRKRLINAPYNAASRTIAQSLSDSKSGEGNLVWVRVPPPVQHKTPANVGVFLICTQRLGVTRPRRLLTRGWRLLAQVRGVFDRRRSVTVGSFGVQFLHGLLLAGGLSHSLLVEALGFPFFPESCRSCLTRLSVARAVRDPQVGAEEIYRDRQDDRGAFLRGDLGQRLEEPELQRCRALEPFGSVVQALGGLVLAFGRDDLRPPLPLGLGLACHRSLHPLRYLYVLDLNRAYLHSPGLGVLVDYYLQLLVYRLAISEQVVEVFLSQHTP